MKHVENRAICLPKAWVCIENKREQQDNSSVPISSLTEQSEPFGSARLLETSHLLQKASLAGLYRWDLHGAMYVHTHYPHQDTNSAFSGHPSALNPSFLFWPPSNTLPLFIVHCMPATHALDSLPSSSVLRLSHPYNLSPPPQIPRSTLVALFRAYVSYHCLVSYLFTLFYERTNGN
jgi:hypothetical protein